MDNSGLTSKTGKGQMSAFKFFENDPLLFSKSVQLIWGCGEFQSGNVTNVHLLFLRLKELPHQKTMCLY